MLKSNIRLLFLVSCTFLHTFYSLAQESIVDEHEVIVQLAPLAGSESPIEPQDVWRTEILLELHTNDKLRDIVSDDLYMMYEDYRRRLKEEKLKQKLLAKGYSVDNFEVLNKNYRLGRMSRSELELVMGKRRRTVHKSVVRNAIASSTSSSTARSSHRRRVILPGAHRSVAISRRNIPVASGGEVHGLTSPQPARVRAVRHRVTYIRKKAHHSRHKRSRLRARPTVPVRTAAGSIARAVRRLLRAKIKSRNLFGARPLPPLSLPPAALRAAALPITRKAPLKAIAKDTRQARAARTWARAPNNNSATHRQRDGYRPEDAFDDFDDSYDDLDDPLDDDLDDYDDY